MVPIWDALWCASATDRSPGLSTDRRTTVPSPRHSWAPTSLNDESDHAARWVCCLGASPESSMVVSPVQLRELTANGDYEPRVNRDLDVEKAAVVTCDVLAISPVMRIAVAEVCYDDRLRGQLSFQHS
jgi:hypothetical protein